MARFGYSPTRSSAHNRAIEDARREWQTAGTNGIIVNLDLTKLSLALEHIGKQHLKGMIVRRGINRGLEKFKSEAHKYLKQFTRIRRPTRLKKGVRLRYAYYSNNGAVEGSYIIRDRNIRITKTYFGASYSNHGKAGGLARWGKSFSPAGASWDSWDGPRTGKKTFMIRQSSPVFIRLKKTGGKGKDAIRPVWGPNPAQIIRLKMPVFQEALRAATSQELSRQLVLAYREAEREAKARFGL